jgi:hypothetical protein
VRPGFVLFDQSPSRSLRNSAPGAQRRFGGSKAGSRWWSELRAGTTGIISKTRMRPGGGTRRALLHPPAEACPMVPFSCLSYYTRDESCFSDKILNRQDAKTPRWNSGMTFLGVLASWRLNPFGCGSAALGLSRTKPPIPSLKNSARRESLRRARGGSRRC